MTLDISDDKTVDDNDTKASPIQQRIIDFSVNPAALNCKTYDCVPLVAALHPAQIYTVAATKCFRWVFTGTDEGYIRKWDFYASMNGKSALTQAQRHHHVDSVTMSGVICSWWENEEQPDGNKLSPVYSMDVQSEALWGLTGMESGNINLVTIRHEEGKCHHVLRNHTAPVSVLRITPQETGVISGSWDKTVLEWDLNTGSVVRNYGGHSSQISSASFRPIYKSSSSSNNDDIETDKSTTEKDTSNSTSTTDQPSSSQTTQVYEEKDENIFLTTSFDGQCFIWDRREPESAVKKLGLPDKTPPWCLSACWSADGSKVYMGRRNGQVDEWDYAAQKLIRSFRMPANSGPVSCVASMPNGKHIICASNDNVRLWNTELESSFNIYPEGTEKPSKTSNTIPFTILPGHHGGCISHIVIDPTCRYMITTSGNRGWDGVSTNACLFYDIASIV
ncbi:WD40 repeat-like protein [Lichtheimia hyalospora FSU 10163]|nr:WD40 repeat-like protein [Lichtheimia hyalospora FSU 10163]